MKDSLYSVLKPENSIREAIRFDIYTHIALSGGWLTKEQAKKLIEERDGRPFDIDRYWPD